MQLMPLNGFFKVEPRKLVKLSSARFQPTAGKGLSRISSSKENESENEGFRSDL